MAVTRKKAKEKSAKEKSASQEPTVEEVEKAPVKKVTKKKRLPKKSRVKKGKQVNEKSSDVQSDAASDESDNASNFTDTSELIDYAKKATVRCEVLQRTVEEKNKELQLLREKLRLVSESATVNPQSEKSVQDQVGEVDGKSVDSAEEVDVNGKPITKVSTTASQPTAPSIASIKPTEVQPVDTDLSFTGTQAKLFRNIKGRKAPSLKALTNVEEMKDFLHDIKSLELEKETITFLSRQLRDKLEALDITSSEKALEYIKNTVKECDDAAESHTIEYWIDKIKFSKDYKTPIEVRLQDLWLNMSIAAKKIAEFDTNEQVRMRFLSMVSEKLDWRLQVTPGYLRMNPQINTIKQFKKHVLKYKELGRKPPTGLFQNEDKAAEKVREGLQVKEFYAAVNRLANTFQKTIDERNAEQSGVQEKEVRRTTLADDSSSSGESESSSESSSEVSEKPPAIPDKEFLICSQKMLGDGYEGYTIRLEDSKGKFKDVPGILDSGAQTNCAVYEDYHPYCKDVKELSNRVNLVPWQGGDKDQKIEATHIGTLLGVRVYYKDEKKADKRYSFRHAVKVFLVPRRRMITSLKSEILIGSKTLRKEKLHPLDALLSKSKGSESSKKRDRSEERRHKSRSRSRERKKKRGKHERRRDDRRSDNRGSDRRSDRKDDSRSSGRDRGGRR